ncbi:MAG: response regulator [Myxococcales bacterium]|nr:response regulator [Myxococcales bacterium]
MANDNEPLSPEQILEQARSLACLIDESPDPVLRVREDGLLLFANAPSRPLLDHYQTEVGQQVPERVIARLSAVLETGESEEVQFETENRTFAIVLVPVPTRRCVNLYGRDITAHRRAEERIRDLARFPDEDPNPTMRVAADGRFLYANEPSQLLLDDWDAGRTGRAPVALIESVHAALASDTPRTLEVQSFGTIYRLEIAPIVGQTYVNIYGRDVTEQKAAERSLIEARDRALEASRAKSNFLANMSHELRTPMNAIIGYSEMLMEEAEDADLKDFLPDLKRIHGAGRHLLALINDILDLSKIEAGRMQVYLEDITISELLRSVADTAEPLAATNRNRFAVECTQAPTSMHSDITKLRQILLNLLSNAFKFTRDGSVTLTVGATRLDGADAVSFAVSDTGIGMDEEQAKRIYGAFSQADDSTTREFGGTGLGLTISKRFCEMLSGTIELTSAPSKGSTFVVTLPLEPPTSSPRSVGPAHSSMPQPPPRDGRQTVLVVDDDPDVREIIGSTLSRAGFEVIAAEDGEQALELARQHQPIAITLDVLMPQLDGWTVLAQLKSDPITHDIPVIIASISDDRNLGFALGAADFMTKPVDRRRLLQVLTRLTGRDRYRRVLIVEDDLQTRELMARTLEKDGFAVSEAENGHQGLERLEEHAPQAIILDLMMPVMNGFEFLERLQANAEWRKIPVIVVTARELSPDEQVFLQDSVQSVLQKGDMPRDALLDRVERLICRSVPPPTTEPSP